MRIKGIYPYDYMDSFARFEETELPPQGAFFSKLSGDPCTDADYAHAVAVWNAFGCETLGDYHDIYLQLDVLLLADFFEKFRKTCLNYYSLDLLKLLFIRPSSLLHDAWHGVGCGTQNVTCHPGFDNRQRNLPFD